MKHDCLAFWGNQVAALVARLDEGARGRPSRGWAARLELQYEYDALLLLRERLNAAGPSIIGRPPKWRKGNVRVRGLLAATCNLLGGLEADRLSTTSGAHVRGARQWHSTGAPDPGAIDEMAQVLWPKLKEAFGV